MSVFLRLGRRAGLGGPHAMLSSSSSSAMPEELEELVQSLSVYEGGGRFGSCVSNRVASVW